MRATWTGVRRLLHIATRRGVERDVGAELRFHIESRVRALVASGSEADAARAMAAREFGDIAASRRELIQLDRQRQERSKRADRWEALVHDLRFSVRSLLRTPWLAALIIVLLALGIGANAATFAVADELFLQQPLGVANPEGLTRLYLRTNWTVGEVEAIESNFVFASYTAVANALDGRARLAAYTAPDSAFVGIGNAVHDLRVVYATSSYFPVLGARLALGRPFSEQENRLGAGIPVAVISYGVWQREFGGDSTVLGKQLEVALARYTIVGVAARDFSGPDLDRTDLWLPIAMQPGGVIGDTPWYRAWRSMTNVRVIARAEPSVTPASVAATATAVYRQGERANVERGPDTSATVLAGPLLESLGPSITPPVERQITTELAAVALIVLLVTCANVANLLLLRGVRRRREIAIRLSLGIPRGRLVRQLLLESTLLAMVASLAAIDVAAWGGTLLRAMILPSVHWATSAVTWRVVLVAVGFALCTGVLAGLAPALRGGRTELTSALKAGSREGGATRSVLRSGLITLQAALSVVLLAGAGLFVRSLLEVKGINVGYDVSRIAYGTVLFRDAETRQVNYNDPDHAVAVGTGLNAVADRLRADPDVESTALATAPPMNGYSMIMPTFEDGTPVPRLNNLDPALTAATPSYFSTTGMQLLRGRFFTDQDQKNGAVVIVITETAARAYWPGRDALGQCLIIARTKLPCATVVGIVRDSHLMATIEKPAAEVFIPINSLFFKQPSWIIVRALPGRTERATATLRDALARQFPTAEPPYVTSATTAHEPELRPWRVGATLFTLFGILALAVATLGVYSTLAYTVSQRLHEMGVRIALGAQRQQIVRLVLAQAMRPLAVGVVCGLALTVALGRFVASMLYGTSPANPLVLGGAAAALLLTGLVGSLAPARRATRVDPAVSLRSE